ncbi:MAG TPA: EpsI family protein [Phycisphaerae bacterium]|nr:EpsI family protein [Phycisphaerae bacterium]
MGDTEEPIQDAGTVSQLGKRALVLSGIIAPVILLTVLLVVSEARATQKSDIAAQAIPATIDEAGAKGAGGDVWTSTRNTFSDAEMDILETHDYVYRTYQDGEGAPVDLCVIFSEDNRKGTHPPDVCLEGNGSRIVMRGDRQERVAGTPLTVRELVTADGDGRYVYYAYFYKCGDSFTPSFYWQQAKIVWNGLTGQNAAGALIRYSAPIGDNSSSGPGLEAARARVDALLAVTFPYIRDRLNPAP